MGYGTAICRTIPRERLGSSCLHRMRRKPPANGRTSQTFAPPVMEARRWLDGVIHPDGRPLLNVSQAAPVDPPPLIFREAIAEIVLNDPGAHLYGPVLGLPALRAEMAARWTKSYGAPISDSQVAITSGCNQAFAAAIATLCDEGSEVIVPVPYYFNHRMWLDMAGVKTVPLDAGPSLIPAPEQAAALITPRTRAIALVSPNDPAGVEYPSSTLQAFYELCKSRKIALIVDETYRDFDGRTGAPHSLFQDPDWADTLIHLYSFSKAAAPTSPMCSTRSACRPMSSRQNSCATRACCCCRRRCSCLMRCRAGPTICGSPLRISTAAASEN